MLSRDVLSRLSQLNRQRLPARREGAEAAAFSAPQNAAPGGGSTGDGSTGDGSTSDGSTSDGSTSELPDGQEVSTPWGSHWLMQQPLSKLWPPGIEWIQRMTEAGSRPAPNEKDSGELQALSRGFPQGVIYLDLETCGFSGSMIFLIGLLHDGPHGLALTQLLARNYAEEKPILQTMWNYLGARSVLATFNGKSFDAPMLHDRSTLHHLGREWGDRSSPEADGRSRRLEPQDRRPHLVHCDLLHHARRRWKSRLPDCKLQTLEQFLCGRRRSGDIPGRDIPSTYHHFVRTRDAWRLRSVLHHNALDLVTLLQISLLASRTL